MQGLPIYTFLPHLLRASLLLPLILLSGCQPIKPDSHPTFDSGYPRPEMQQQTSKSTPEAKPERMKGLDGEAVRELLAAEIAGQRNQIDSALQRYLEQSARLQSPELAKRTTYIAQYAGDEQTTLEAAAIWSANAPENVESRRISSNLLIQQGEFLEAFDFQNDLLTMGEETHFSYLAAQSGHADEPTREELLSLLTELQKLHPDNPDLLTARAQLLYYSGLYSDAFKAIEHSLALSPLNVRSILLKADLLITSKSPRAGIKYLRQAMAKQPDNLRLQLALARTLVKDGDIEEAQKAFTQMVNMHPDNGQLALSLSLIFMENGLPEQAREELNKLLANGFEKDTAHFYLGRIDEQEGNLNSAIDHYRSVTDGKDFLQAQVRATRLLIQEGAFDEARAHLTELRQKLPGQRNRLFLLEAELLQSQSQLPEAYQLLTDALKSQGMDYELLYSRAMIALQQQDIELMEQDLRQILKNEPNNAMVLNTLGYTLTEYTDRYPEALQLIRKAAALKPGDPAITDSLGWVYYKLGQIHEAVLFLQQAYNQLQDPEVAVHLIEVFWVSGHQEEAVALLQEARQLFENHTLLQDLEARFPELATEATQSSSVTDNKGSLNPE